MKNQTIIQVPRKKINFQILGGDTRQIGKYKCLHIVQRSFTPKFNVRYKNTSCKVKTL